MLLGGKSKTKNVSLQEIINRIPQLKYRYLGSFRSDCVPTLKNDTFAIINAQPSNMQDEHWIMIANSCHKIVFAEFLGRKKYNFFKQQYKPIR